MPYKHYISGVGIAGFISFISFMLVVTKLNPFESTLLSLMLFFISLFVMLVCFFTVAGFFLRLHFNHNEIFYSHVITSMRQGILLSLCACASLFLLIFGLLRWWSGLLIVLIVTLVEFYITRESSNS